MNRVERLRAASTFFRRLEARYGDLNALRSEPVVLTSERSILPAHLDALFAHDAHAVVVRDFASAETRLNLVREIESVASDGGASNWTISHPTSTEQVKTDVDTLGDPHNVAVATNRLESYFSSSLRSTRRFRDSGDPIDRLRLELDESYVRGAILHRDPSESALPRVASNVRIMRRTRGNWRGGFVHVDDLDVLSPAKGLFSANVYLQTPPAGGELEIWPLTWRTRWEFAKNAFTLSKLLLNDEDSQRYVRSRLGRATVISPRDGDLVLLCAQRPHAVKGPLLGGDRISLQTFIDRRPNSPLMLGS